MGGDPTLCSQSIGKSTSFPIDVEDDENIRIFHRNMLFPVQTVTDPIPKTNDKHVALMKANLLMDLYFDD